MSLWTMFVTAIKNVANLSGEPPVNFINFVKSDNSSLKHVVLAIRSVLFRSYGL